MKYDGVVPAAGEAGELEQALAAELTQRLADLRFFQEQRSLRKAADEVRAIWRAANVYLVAGAPWSHVAGQPDRAAVVVRTSVNLVALAATVAWPFIPATAERVLEALGCAARPSWPPLAAQALTLIAAGRKVGVPPILFEKLSAEWVETNRAKFAGETDCDINAASLIGALLK
jgi:methionyl-tRNA synthetase